MTELAWPTAAVVIALFTFFGWLRWLQRETENQKTARELRAEVNERDKDWLEKFGSLERRQAVIETAIRNLQSDRPNPLGRSYSPRST